MLWISNAHLAELLGHLGNPRRRITWSGRLIATDASDLRLSITSVRTICWWLITWLWLRIVATSFQLSSQSGIGTLTKLKRFLGVSTLLLSSSLVV